MKKPRPSYSVTKLRNGRYFWVAWPGLDDWEPPLGEGYSYSLHRAEHAAEKKVGAIKGFRLKAKFARRYHERKGRAAKALETQKKAKAKARQDRKRAAAMKAELEDHVRREVLRAELAKEEAIVEPPAPKKPVENACRYCRRASSLLVNCAAQGGPRLCPTCFELRRAYLEKKLLVEQLYKKKQELEETPGEEQAGPDLREVV